MQDIHPHSSLPRVRYCLMGVSFTINLSLIRPPPSFWPCHAVGRAETNYLKDPRWLRTPRDVAVSFNSVATTKRNGETSVDKLIRTYTDHEIHVILHFWSHVGHFLEAGCNWGSIWSIVGITANMNQAYQPHSLPTGHSSEGTLLHLSPQWMISCVPKLFPFFSSCKCTIYKEVIRRSLALRILHPTPPQGDHNAHNSSTLPVPMIHIFSGIP